MSLHPTMARQTTHSDLDPADFDDEEDLSDEQMKALLRRAKKRSTAAVMVEESHEGLLPLYDSASLGVGEPQVKIPKLKVGALPAPYVSSVNGAAKPDPRRLLNQSERWLSSQPRHVESQILLREAQIKKKMATAGPDWYNLPKTNLTPELKKDLQLLKMRDVLDPKRHYKKDNSTKLAPEFSQVGTIVEGPTEFFSSRITKKERKRTLVEETLGDERSTGRFKNKYNDIQTSKTGGRKAFYKNLKAKRHHGVYQR